MILVIAEKPSLGRDIADALPGQVTERNNRFIRKGDYAVTWVFGHMLSLKEPEDYDMKYKKWSLDDLPIYDLTVAYAIALKNNTPKPLYTLKNEV